MPCRVDNCRQGRDRCAAPQICFEAPISREEREQIHQDAFAAAARYIATQVPQFNPWPRGTRRHVTWSSFFLEETIALPNVPTPL
jgi:hypothetical protein